MIGARVLVRRPDGSGFRAHVVYVHETRNPYAADRTCYGVRSDGGGVSDGWRAEDFRVTHAPTETSLRFVAPYRNG